jgi:hypothetical protein
MADRRMANINRSQRLSLSETRCLETVATFPFSVATCPLQGKCILQQVSGKQTSRATGTRAAGAAFSLMGRLQESALDRR